MASSLKADPQILYLPNPPFRGIINIQYKNAFYPYDFYLWERKTGPGNQWMKIDPEAQERFTPDRQGVQHGGSFVKSVQVGQIFEYAMYHDERDPNVNPDDPPPDARILIAGVGAPADLYDSVDPPNWGGTWFKWSVHTRNDTVALLEFSTQPPMETSPPGMYAFPNGPDAGFKQTGVFQNFYDLEFASDDFLPGNTYYALLHLIDPQGSWQVLQQEFKLRQRVINIRLNKIHIVNDGVDGDGRGYFDVWVARRNGQGPFQKGADELTHFHVPQQVISDRPSPGHDYEEWINLLGYTANPVVIGPYSVTTSTRHVAVLTRGILKQTFSSDVPAGNFLPGPNFLDGSWNQDGNLVFEIGQENEKMVLAEGFTRAYPFSAGEQFQFSLQFLYDVYYLDAP